MQELLSQIKQHKQMIDQLTGEYNRMVAVAKELSHIPQCQPQADRMYGSLESMKQIIASLLKQTQSVAQTYQQIKK